MSSQRGSECKKIILCGHSLGGRVGLFCANNNSKIDAVVSIMSGSSLPQWGKDGLKRSIRDLPDKQEDKKIFELPHSFLEDALRYDPRKIVPKVSQLKFFIAGGLDMKATPEEVEELYNLASDPKEFILINNVDHDYRFSVGKVRIVNDYILRFLKDKNL